jgi:hypothetical protein
VPVLLTMIESDPNFRVVGWNADNVDRDGRQLWTFQDDQGVPLIFMNP